MVDDLIKALSLTKHEHFMGIIDIEDKRELLAFIK